MDFGNVWLSLVKMGEKNGKSDLYKKCKFVGSPSISEFLVS